MTINQKMRNAYLVILTVLISSCSTHYIKKEDLIEQFKNNGDSTIVLKTEKNDEFLVKRNGEDETVPRKKMPGIIADSAQSKGKVTLYNLGFGKKVLVENKNKEKVQIKLDQNSGLIINKGEDTEVKTYFTSSWLMDDIIFGYRSRLLAMERKIKVQDIRSIEIYSEFTREEKPNK